MKEEEEEEKAQMLHKSASAFVFSLLVVGSWNLLSPEFVHPPIPAGYPNRLDITSYYIKPGNPTADKRQEEDTTETMGK